MLAIETYHETGIGQKLFGYLPDAFKLVIFFGIAYVIALLIVKILGRRSKLNQSANIRRFWVDVIFYAIVLSVSLYTVVFWKNCLRYSYSIIFIALILIGIRHRKELSPDEAYLYQCGTVVSLLGFCATLLLTNLKLVASVPYLVIAVVMAFLPISKVFGDVEIRKALRIPIKVVLLSGIVFIVFRSVYIIRPLFFEVYSIMQVRGIVKEGPAIGVISEYMGPYMQNVTIQEWGDYIHEGDSIYLIGGSLDTLAYLYSDTTIAAPSLTTTPGYNETILKYWEMNPERYPDVIVASCWYGELNAELQQNDWILTWLEQEYAAYSVDGSYWRYYYKRD